MAHESFTTGKCAECGNPLTLEVGITNYGPEGGSKLYCTPCSPNRGKGYTLADLAKWREDSQIARAEREMQLMEQLGPDVYLHVIGPTFPPDCSTT